jgi:hypothetical protein
VRLAVALAGLVLLAGCGSTRTVVRTVTVQSQDVVYVGHVVSMQRTAGGYFVRFDPEFDLVGISGGVAQAQDEHVACAPRACSGVPNDIYRVDETHRAYTFFMPFTAKGTVLTHGQKVAFLPVTAAQFASIVSGRSHIKLYEPLLSGVSITVRVDSITRFAQLYKP